MLVRPLTLLLAAMIGACGSGPSEFRCDQHTDCVSGQNEGRCEQSGHCSYASTDCDSGWQFGNSAGPEAGLCVLACGDGVTETRLREECDIEVSDFASQCTNLGFYDEGQVSCSNECTLDVSQCSGTCGDQLVNGPEVCDGLRPDISCMALGYDLGATDCTSLCGFDLDRCADIGWVEAEAFSDKAYSSIFGTSADDIWVTGVEQVDSTIYHYDGTTWSSTPRDGESLYSLWSHSTSDVWAVGTQTLRFNGSVWNVETTASTATMYAVFGTGSDDVWLVGRESTVQHYHDSSFAKLQAPPNYNFHDVWASPAAGAWVVGAKTDAGDGRLVNYRNDSLTEYPTTEPMYGVWGLADDDVWAVGKAGAILHFDGVQWTPTASPTPSTLVSVWGANAADVWAVGEAGETIHYDGTSWSPVEAGVVERLLDVWGTQVDNVISIGQKGVMLEYSGRLWAGALSELEQHTFDLWASAPDNVWVASVGRLWHSDGQSWQELNPPAGYSFLAVWGSGPDDVWAASGGTVVHFDGAIWTERQDSPITTTIYDIFGLGPSSVFFAAEEKVYHYDGSQWSDLGAPTSARRVWGTGPDDLWVVGQAGAIAHYDGSAWQSFSNLTSENLHQAWGSGADDVWVVGDDGVALHYDGQDWTQHETGTTEALKDIRVQGPANVWLLASTTLHHFDGNYWSEVRLRPSTLTTSLHSLWNDEHHLYIQGAKGFQTLFFSRP